MSTGEDDRQAALRGNPGLPDLGVAMPVFKASAKDPLLSWIASGSSLHINLGGESTYDVSLKGSAQAAKAFAAACNS